MCWTPVVTVSNINQSTIIHNSTRSRASWYKNIFLSFNRNYSCTTLSAIKYKSFFLSVSPGVQCNNIPSLSTHVLTNSGNVYPRTFSAINNNNNNFNTHRAAEGIPNELALFPRPTVSRCLVSSRQRVITVDR